jgi:hypothetical protein
LLLVARYKALVGMGIVTAVDFCVVGSRMKGWGAQLSLELLATYVNKGELESVPHPANGSTIATAATRVIESFFICIFSPCESLENS